MKSQVQEIDMSLSEVINEAKPGDYFDVTFNNDIEEADGKSIYYEPATDYQAAMFVWSDDGTQVQLNDNVMGLRFVKRKKLIIGVDFDGTIVEEAFPEIGRIKERTVRLMKKMKEKGHTIIVWTARSDKYEQQAIDFLDDNNIPYDFVNENTDCDWYRAGIQSRKLFCHYYLDDRAVHIKDIHKLENIIGG